MHQFGDMFTLERVEQIYLDELAEESDSLGVEIVKLVVEPEETAVDLTQSLVEKAKVQLTDVVRQRNIIELVNKELSWKLFPEFSN
ncbi:MAG: DUF2887 domain-containing protein [Cyanobacteriota bacterium]|nr:DUF2887 domain-containing protein [Cyanobacteriota bacterium]